MTGEMVLQVGEFGNATYGTRIGRTVEEDGKTSRNTLHSLTRALRRESGISSLSGGFGPGPWSVLPSKHPIAYADRRDLFVEHV
ncbi:hypothetical protein [Streptomyces sp. BF23-18]|uniref:hypothetical protein n=1 Tax=unclassified Streptomyces TaxID=2593676 RepID=UPI0034E4F609